MATVAKGTVIELEEATAGEERGLPQLFRHQNQQLADALEVLGQIGALEGLEEERRAVLGRQDRRGEVGEAVEVGLSTGGQTG